MYKFLAPLCAAVLLASCSPAPPPAAEPAPAPAPAAAPAVHHMVPGTSGIKAMQHALAAKGYYHGKVDGVVGAQTRNAVARFQQDMGIQPVTGNPDGQTWSALGLSE